MTHLLDRDSLLQLAKNGDREALSVLIQNHQTEISRVVAWQLDRRLSRREDIADIVQETLLAATRRFDDYLKISDNITFGVWLRLMARERVIDTHRKHFGAECRNINREQYSLTDQSSIALVGALLGREPTPSKKLARAEMADQVSRALSQLDEDDRELIMWRHFEQLSIRETARILAISEAAASKRYVRALESLKRILVQIGFNVDESLIN